MIVENKIKSFLLKNRYVLLMLFASFIALWMRHSVLSYASGDYLTYLHPWFSKIKALGGVTALSKQVGDYNILYQFLIGIFTYFPIKDIYLYKALSIAFDFLLALSTGWLTVILMNDRKNSLKIFSLVYTVVLFLPTVSFNSAVWAQCDSIYTTFLILSLAFLLKERYIPSFIMLGLAFAFKLQAVFVLPFFVLVWLVKKRVYVWHFLVTIFVFWLSGVPGFIFGRSLLAPFEIYMKQTGSYKALYMGYHNFSGLFLLGSNSPQAYLMFKKWFIMLTLMVLVFGFVVFLKWMPIDSFGLIQIAAWTIYTCVMFLPSIHDRYAYCLDILMVVLVVVKRKYVYVAISEILSSFLTYIPFIFFRGNSEYGLFFSLISLVIYVVFTVMMINELQQEKTATKKSADLVKN